jgi:hypothetical protein
MLDLFPIAADENLDRRIVFGLRARGLLMDPVTVVEAGLQGASDPQVLEWAAATGRILLTHDRKTMPDYAYHRMAAGGHVSGLFVIPTSMPIGDAIADVALVVQGSTPGEWRDRIVHLPCSAGRTARAPNSLP